MTDDTGAALAVDDLVDYCHTQAGLLSGHVERMREEADDLLSEIDTDVAELRGHLEEHSRAVEGTEGPSTPTGPATGDVDLEAFEELEDEIEQKQLLVEAKQTRMQAFQELASAYTDLGSELATEFDDGETALSRLLEFEAERDAPAYFDERETLLEAAHDRSADDG